MLELSTEKKLGGLLAPVTALRSRNDLGVGDTEALVEFVVWAAAKGFGLVQILPINETGNDHSPYNIISSMAIDPLTISTTPDWLPDLTRKDFDAICAKHEVATLKPGPVKYAAVAALKRELLQAAFRQIRTRKSDPMRARAFARFETSEADWLEPYSRFRALIEWSETEIVDSWPAAHRSPSAVIEWESELDAASRKRFRDLARFYRYVQWVARTQWKTVRAACERLGVALMGDIPVGVSLYSADVWETPIIFDTTRSSGAPPEKVFATDLFTEKWGQNWGFPLYNWQGMSLDNFAWWRRRLHAACEIFHFLRVDHALGFFRIYSFPWRPQENERFTPLDPAQASAITGGPLPGFVAHDDSTEENRERNRFQGEMLLRVFLEETGPHRLIAEDLGEVAPYVRPTLEALEVPGFKIPQWEYTDGHMTPGADYQRLSLATFATHDHPPIRVLWERWAADPSAPHLQAMREMLTFCGCPDLPVPQAFTPEIHAAFIRGLFASNSWLAVHQITDLFGLPDRFNVPGAVGNQNWTTRIEGPPAEWDTLHEDAITLATAALKDTARSTLKDA